MKLILSICLIATGLRADSTTYDVLFSGIRETTIVLTPGAFSEEYVERVARAQLARIPHPNLIHLRIYDADGGPPLPKPDHFGFEQWRQQYVEQTKLTVGIAEMIARGEDVVLRIRDKTGKVSKRVLSGRDPLTLLVQGREIEIVYFDFNPNQLPTFGIFVRSTSPLRIEMGESLLQALEASFPKLDLTVTARMDSWFVLNPRYPVQNPLIRDLSPPSSSEEYRRTPTLECNRLAGSITCQIL